MFVLAGIFTPGVAKSLLSASGNHVKRMRYTYQLMICWINIMLYRVYQNYLDSNKFGPYETFGVWEVQMRDPKPCGPDDGQITFECPTFRF